MAHLGGSTRNQYIRLGRKMVVKLVEVCKSTEFGASNQYDLREVFINPEHVVCLRFR